jgi:hypothetical protein
MNEMDAKLQGMNEIGTQSVNTCHCCRKWRSLPIP